MRIGIPKEVHAHEKRVAATPSSIQKLIKLGYEVYIESGAGDAASYSDEAYQSAGAHIVEHAKSVWNDADLVLKVRAPEVNPELGVHELELLRAQGHLISLIWPAQNAVLLEQLQQRQCTALALDAIPRISRAQKMDVLSSMANIAGYRAVIEAANAFGRFFTGQITAAGKIEPAKVLVIGAGVAGLAAIGAAKGLGAIVRAFDTRPEVADQVKSMGAEFLPLAYEEEGSGEGGYAREMSKAFLDAEMALFSQQAMEVDIIICTALIPGKRAPELITAGMVESMKPGSVIVDLAAEQGGNCALTEVNQVVHKHGVHIIGYSDLTSRLANVASELFATNLVHLMTALTPEQNGKLVVDMDDDVIRGATVVKSGVLTWPAPAPKVSVDPKPQPATEQPPLSALEPDNSVTAKQSKGWGCYAALALMVALLLAIGCLAPPSFLSHLSVFALSCLIGWQVVWNVTPALHTPLMSVTNAISGIIIIGALLHLAQSQSWFISGLMFVAVLVASVNIAGGFLVTQRMLKMFRK